MAHGRSGGVGQRLARHGGGVALDRVAPLTIDETVILLHPLYLC